MMALLFLAASLVVESKDVTDQTITLTIRNTSDKAVTGFSYSAKPNVSHFVDLRNIEGIEPNGYYKLRLFSDEPIQITGVVFIDDSYEGEEAKEILARREGIRLAELYTARQIRQFLQFNTVLDESAMNFLDHELEEAGKIPRDLTDKEKSAWNEGYISTRETIRKRIKEVPENHRLQQLKQIGRIK